MMTKGERADRRERELDDVLLSLGDSRFDVVRTVEDVDGEADFRYKVDFAGYSREGVVNLGDEDYWDMYLSIFEEEKSAEIVNDDYAGTYLQVKLEAEKPWEVLDMLEFAIEDALSHQ